MRAENQACLNGQIALEKGDANNEIQAYLLSTTIELVAGGATQPHVDTGGGDSTSDLP